MFRVVFLFFAGVRVSGVFHVDVFIFPVVYVLGHVGTPGPKPYLRGRKPVTLTQLISISGGFSQYAKTSAVRILRKQEGRARIIEVDFDEIIDGERDDVILEPDDLVWVPESML